ncbi:MAG: M55 family metallopeptidase [Gemmatimonadales bacterium]|nr:MAG: M55 family metallopeptidase [Gemmatimonadales bacterium]
MLLAGAPAPADGQDSGGPRIFISVDMEGIGGVGSPGMTSASGKDYGTARRLMTDELNTVIRALFDAGAGHVLVNDSHGDHQNVLHTELDPRAEYVQGSIKRLGMVAELDSSFDAAIFLGYHAMAGVGDAFLAHTGSGSVKGLWVNEVEVGEGGMNALYAGSVGVPVILASGDRAFGEEFTALTGAPVVVTKEALGSSAARLRSPESVRAELAARAGEALRSLPEARPLEVRQPVVTRIRFASTTRPYLLEAIPGVIRVDGSTVEFRSESMGEAYQMIRLAYRFISW